MLSDTFILLTGWVNGNVLDLVVPIILVHVRVVLHLLIIYLLLLIWLFILVVDLVFVVDLLVLILLNQMVTLHIIITRTAHLVAATSTSSTLACLQALLLDKFRVQKHKTLVHDLKWTSHLLIVISKLCQDVLCSSFWKFDQERLWAFNVISCDKQMWVVRWDFYNIVSLAKLLGSLVKHDSILIQCLGLSNDRPFRLGLSRHTTLVWLKSIVAARSSDSWGCSWDVRQRYLVTLAASEVMLSKTSLLCSAKHLSVFTICISKLIWEFTDIVSNSAHVLVVFLPSCDTISSLLVL